MVARFSTDALGCQLQGPPEPTAAWKAWLRERGIPEEHWNDASAIIDPEGRGPRIYFQRVPEPKRSRTVCAWTSLPVACCPARHSAHLSEIMTAVSPRWPGKGQASPELPWPAD